MLLRLACRSLSRALRKVNASSSLVPANRSPNSAPLQRPNAAFHRTIRSSILTALRLTDRAASSRMLRSTAFFMAGGDVFADTSALYAFVNKRDVLHSEARRIVERLLHVGRRLIASDYVVAESV